MVEMRWAPIKSSLRSKVKPLEIESGLGELIYFIRMGISLVLYLASDLIGIGGKSENCGGGLSLGDDS